MSISIGVTLITQNAHVRNKNSNTQRSSHNVVKVMLQTLRNCSERKEVSPSGSKLFALKKFPFLKGT